jgi:hypothetical protein
MLKRLRRYAVLLTRLPGGEHIAGHAAYAEELVQMSLADLLGGVLRWDPQAGDLEPYLMDVVRLRARRDRQRAIRYKHLSIGTASSSEHSELIDEVEAHLSEYGATPYDDEAVDDTIEVTRSVSRLRELTSADPLASRFLDAIEQHASTRAEIMRVAKLTRAEYHNTRRRLARLFARLPLGERNRAREN